MLRSDVDRKDRLISELSSHREIERLKGHESAKVDFFFEKKVSLNYLKI